MNHPETLPSVVTLVCPACGRTVRTRQSGNTTRCPKNSGGCGEAIPVPAGSTRPRVPLRCTRCANRWQSRAREGSTVRCPECGHPRRVPTGARDHLALASPRPRAERAGTPPSPRPRPARTAPAPHRGFLATLGNALFGPPVPPGVSIECLHCAHQWRTTAAPGNTIRCPECRRSRRVPTGTAPSPRPRAEGTGTPPSPRPGPARAALAPLRPPAAPAGPPAPVDPQTLPLAERNRRDYVSQTVRSLSPRGGLLVWYNQPPGACEALDTTRVPAEQRCPHRATHAVRYVQGPTTTHAYACPHHAAPLAALAQGSPYVTATVHPLGR